MVGAFRTFLLAKSGLSRERVYWEPQSRVGVRVKLADELTQIIRKDRLEISHGDEVQSGDLSVVYCQIRLLTDLLTYRHIDLF